MKVISLLVILLALALVDGRAPLLGIGARHVIPDQYLVIFHQNTTMDRLNVHVTELRARLSITEKILHVFDIGTLMGYSASLSKANMEIELDHADVSYIEVDQVVTIVREDPYSKESNSTWGLDRIDQRELPLDGSYSYFDSAGEDVNAYIIDTGILTSHEEFGGRAKFGFDATGEGKFDKNGHGTHVAGTVGGKTYGVAKKVNLIGVKVLATDGSGSYSGVIAGIDYVVKQHKKRSKAKSIANMSLGGGASSAIDDVVEQAIIAGVTMIVAAGNEYSNACKTSPARVGTAITVAATDKTDTRPDWSNWGNCVDVFAPGVDIKSAWIDSDSSTSVLSGTSMASPHVCGIIAVYISHLEFLGKPAPSPVDVTAWIKMTGTPGVVKRRGYMSPNLFVYSPFSDIDYW